jgi:hypothetical protein
MDELEGNGSPYEEVKKISITPDFQENEESADQRNKIYVLDILTRETGEGSLESYLNHPLNFNSSLAMARIIRGVTGLFNKSLNFAVLDIASGMFEMMGKKKVGAMRD